MAMSDGSSEAPSSLDFESISDRALVRVDVGDHVARDVNKPAEVCMRACATCGAECRNHASEHEHGKGYAEACQRFEKQCRKMLQEREPEPDPVEGQPSRSPVLGTPA